VVVTGPEAEAMLEAEAVIRNFGSRIKVVRACLTPALQRAKACHAPASRLTLSSMGSRSER